MKSSFWPTTTPLGSTDEKMCASYTNVCLFLLERTWNSSSQSFVKWTDEQVSHLIVLVVSFNNALQLSHILCFIKLSSSIYENLHDSVSRFGAKFSWTKFSLPGICFSSVQTFHKSCTCVKSSNIVKGIVFSPSSVTKYSYSIKFQDDWTSSMRITFTIIFTHCNSSISLIFK